MNNVGSLLGASLLMLATAAPVLGADAPIVQPGAPGEMTRPLSAEQAIALANTRYSPADVAFM